MTAFFLRVLICILTFSSVSFAQDYPRQPIRIVVPFAAGGGTDVFARMIATGLSERLGTQVYVENQGGSGSVVGTGAVARAQPDGYTLLSTSIAYAINPALYKKLSYKVDDLVPIALVADAPLVLTTHPALPVTNLREFIELVKANPGKYNYGSSGIGGGGHLAAEFFKSMAGLDIVHVPFRGAGPALTEVLAGRIALLVDQVPTVAPHIQSGTLRGLAVASKTRSNLLPNVPTSAEAGLPGYEVNSWNLILAPRDTPKPIIDRLNRELTDVLRNPQLQARYAELGAVVPKPLSPEETAQFIRDEMKKWGDIVRSTGATME